MTYNQAIEKLGNKEQKKIANNTYLVRRNDGAVAVRLYATDILTFRPDRTVVLETNGWRSVTTKARLNDYMPVYRIVQIKGAWYYGPYDADVREGDVIHEVSGNIVRENGAIVGLQLRKGVK